MQQPKYNYEDAINALNEMNQNIENQMKESEDVKNGTMTLDEKLDQEGYTLFKMITEDIEKMMNEKVVQDVFEIIKNSTDKQMADAICSLMMTLMAFSSHDAVSRYDELITEKLNHQFEIINNNMLMLKSSIEAHDAVLKVQKKKIDDIEKKSKNIPEGKFFNS